MAYKTSAAKRKSKREWYARNKEYKNKYDREQANKRAYENQTKAFELAGVFGCSNKDCQEDVRYYHQIDWHHQKPEKKTMKLSWGFRYLVWEKVKKELIDAEVIPLCKVCHAREEMHKEHEGKDMKGRMKTHTFK